MQTFLSSPVTELHGVGPAVSKRLTHLGINFVYELLFHLPFKYDDFSIITPIDNCELDELVTIRGKVLKIKNRTSWKNRRLSITEAEIEDDTEKIKVIWFNQPYIAEQFKIGDELYLSGKITKSKYGKNLSNPVYERYKAETTHTARIVPKYHLTYGITHKQMRFFIKQALALIDSSDAQDLPDWIPQSIINNYDLLALSSALQKIHFPENWDDIEEAKYRLGFEELLLVQLFVLATKSELAAETAQSIDFNKEKFKDIISQLPFQLTNAQRKATWEIIQDLELSKPMNRLLEGDVGSGKTIVAALALYNVVLAGQQGAIMAPTEILAEQHYETISQLFANQNIEISLWTANNKKITSQRGVDDKVNDTDLSTADIVIGTHALIQKNANFKKLALAIVDEQHRFGVSQRKHLKEQSGNVTTTPHLLSMTATPIPRSLALTIYGDLELSILNELPAGRKKIITKSVPVEKKSAMYKFIRSKVELGEQVYVIAPRIEEADTDDESKVPEDEVSSVTSEYKKLAKVFPKLKLAILHGKLPASEKKQTMEAFNSGKIDILISTTVVEVGVDVPNATIIVIEGADRFGLAQLHQLRGRVGRSNKQSYCFVCTDNENNNSNKRLHFFSTNSDGFKLAEYDLKVRGPGDVYGKSQSGYLTHFKVADLSNKKQVKQTQVAAREIFQELQKYPEVKKRLEKFVQQLHLE
ncbi:MAG: ATP-dependent DNA helicase RecG [bacterium]|nr:ATP-dependent DNA helicase RecG [bacterium]